MGKIIGKKVTLTGSIHLTARLRRFGKYDNSGTLSFGLPEMQGKDEIVLVMESIRRNSVSTFVK